MIRLCADTNKPMADGYVFYNLSENGMDTYPEKNSEITLLCTYIQTGFVSGDSDDTNYVNNMCAESNIWTCTISILESHKIEYT